MPQTDLGVVPRVALIARDWREAYSVTDGHPLVFDRMRVLRSSRMAVVRFSLMGGRITPFAEIAGGQWRVDADWMPRLRQDTEIAGQVAAGLEIRLAKRCALAWDVEQTQVFRDTREVNEVTVLRLFGTFGALRAEF